MGHTSTVSLNMMRSTSFVAGDTQQSPAFTVGNRSVITADSGSVSGSEDEDGGGDDTTINGSRKRKRSHVKISYVILTSFSSQQRFLRLLMVDYVKASSG